MKIHKIFKDIVIRRETRRIEDFMRMGYSQEEAKGKVRAAKMHAKNLRKKLSKL